MISRPFSTGDVRKSLINDTADLADNNKKKEKRKKKGEEREKIYRNIIAGYCSEILVKIIARYKSESCRRKFRGRILFQRTKNLSSFVNV